MSAMPVQPAEPAEPAGTEAASVAAVRRAVDGLSGLVAERAGETERAGRLPDDVVAALRRTGVNRLALPRALGGFEAPVADMVDVVERVAAVDGSTAWCMVIGFGSNVFAGYLPEAGARRVFADPDQGNATMFAPCGQLAPDTGEGAHGRYRLTGRWPFTSNCLHSAWAGLGAVAPPAAPSGGAPGGEHPGGQTRTGGPDNPPWVAFVPVADLTVEPTWDAAGLRGTGSHHVTAGDVPVDADHCCTFTDRPWPEGTMWRLPVYSVLFPLLAAVPLGLARGALDEIGRQAREGRSARRGQLADDAVSMAELAVADTRLRGARAGLHAAVAEAHRRAARAEPVDRCLQARIVLAGLEACDVGVEVTSTAHLLGGGAAAYAGSRLLRALCDVEAARQHLMFAHKHRSELAKALVGLDAAYPPYVT
jgi:alkylation response protein AidB-like acyl-CoA dehydrogenase